MKSTILNFYQGQCRHIGSSLLLTELLELDNETLDNIHGYVHWVFPLRKPSNRYGGPTLTDEELDEFLHNKDLRIKLLRSFGRFLNYFGFTWEKSEDGGRIRSSDDAGDRRSKWLYRNSLHYNSITRILQCLMLLGFEDLANHFYAALTELFRRESKMIGKNRFIFWTQAVRNRDYWNSKT